MFIQLDDWDMLVLKSVILRQNPENCEFTSSMKLRSLFRTHPI